MGVNIYELVDAKNISFNDLKGKRLAVDAYLTLYQFLASIRQRDGSYLKDSKGNVTSHLAGIYSRITRLMRKDIKLIFVFDGKPPKLKQKERERRAAIKADAELKFKEAEKKQDIAEMEKYAKRTVKLSKEMVEEAKHLLDALGIPIVQAPCEGEAQAVQLVKDGNAYAVATQDADVLMFGAPRLVKNLTLSSRKKLPGQFAFKEISPELFEISKIHNTLGIDQNQLIALGMLIGTDYNIGGIKGIGPKNALKLVKKQPNLNKLFEEVKWNEFFDYSWKEVFDTIKNMETDKDYKLIWKTPDENLVKEILCKKHDFSEERVSNTLEELRKHTEEKKQTGLDKFF